MSKESYAKGFAKSASAMGVDPVALAKFAQEVKPVEYFTEYDLTPDPYYQKMNRYGMPRAGRFGSDYRAWEDPMWLANRGMDPSGEVEPWKQTASYKMMQEFNDPAKNTPDKQIARARRWGVKVPQKQTQMAGTQNAQRPQTPQPATQPNVNNGGFDFRSEAIKLLRGAKNSNVKLDRNVVSKMRSQWKDFRNDPSKFTEQQQRDMLAQWKGYVGLPSARQAQPGTAVAGSVVPGKGTVNGGVSQQQNGGSRRRISVSPIRGRDGQDIRSIGLRT